MTEKDVNILLDELVALPHELQWVEFKMNAGSITNEQIGEYISAMSNGATIANKFFGYLVWGIEDATHSIKGTNFRFASTDYYKKMIEAFIKKYGSATRKQIEDLIFDKLSDTLTVQQKRNKVGNLISALRIKGIIENKGSFAKPVWVKRV